MVGPGWAGDDDYWLSTDGGRTGKLRKLPVPASAGVAAVAFDSPTQGMAVEAGGSCSQPAPVLTTDNAGVTWKVAGSLSVISLELALSPTLAVVTGWGCGGNSVGISTDLGHTWSEEATGNPCGPASVFARTVALYCADLVPGGQYVLLSHDAGRNWVVAGSSRPRAGYPSVGSLVVTGPSSLFASGPPGVLWRTSDGGAHWAVGPLLLPLAA